MRYRYRRIMLALQCVIVVLVAGLGYRQLVLLRDHDRQARQALRDRATLDAAYRALLALDRERAAIFDRQPDSFARRATELDRAIALMDAQASGAQRREVARVARAHRDFAGEVGNALSSRATGATELARLDREATHLLRMVEHVRQRNVEATSLGLMHRDLIWSAVATMSLVSVITLLLVVATFALSNRLSRSWAATEAMAAAERVRADFMRFISHELHNSMAALHDGVSMLCEESLDSDMRRVVSQALNQRVGSLSRLIVNLLTADRASSGRLQPRLQAISAAGAISATVQRMSACDESLARRLQVRKASDAYAMADPDYVDLVLSNLIDNARKFSPDDTPIEISVRAYDNRVQFSVGDRGPGIPFERRQRIFDLYETSSDGRASRGSGIGLYLCKALVEAQGGSIEVTGSPGHGSVFAVDLPAAQNRRQDQYGKRMMLSRSDNEGPKVWVRGL